MNELIKQPDYLVGDLMRLSKDLAQVEAEVIKQAEHLNARAKSIKEQIEFTKRARDSILDNDNGADINMVLTILQLLGWQHNPNRASTIELELQLPSKPDAIVRSLHISGLAERHHLSDLCDSLMRYWDETGTEAKGILLLSQAQDALHLNDYAADLAALATKKEICIMSTKQLLAMFRDVYLEEAGSEAIRSVILASNGILRGYELIQNEQRFHDSYPASLLEQNHA